MLLPLDFTAKKAFPLIRHLKKLTRGSMCNKLQNLQDFVTWDHSPIEALKDWNYLCLKIMSWLSFPKFKHPTAVKMASSQPLTRPVLQRSCSGPCVSSCHAAAHRQCSEEVGQKSACSPCVWASSQVIPFNKLATDPPFMSKHGEN